MNWVTIAVFDTPIEANLQASVLESFEIPCFIKDENMGGMYFNVIGGIELQVPGSLEEKARHILENTDWA